jgi:hypothetical protein
MGVDEKRRPMMTSGKKGFADRIGQLEEFNPLFKICSKLMHRTALSIAAENTRGGLDAIIPILKDSAFVDLASISHLIKAHVETVGPKPTAEKSAMDCRLEGALAADLVKSMRARNEPMAQKGKVA